MGRKKSAIKASLTIASAKPAAVEATGEKEPHGRAQIMQPPAWKPWPDIAEYPTFANPRREP